MKTLYKLLLRNKTTRSQFLKLCAHGGVALAGHGLMKHLYAGPLKTNARTRRTVPLSYDLIAAHGDDPFAMTVKAVQAMGGMEKFVKKNSVVLIKPNIGWDRTPEQAGNTNPDVVAALVELCYQAGARRVNVFDNTCNDARRCYVSSGIEKAAKEKGAEVFIPDDWNTENAVFPYKSPMNEWPIYREALTCDTFINVPIVKHHGLTKLTLSMKNLMGVCSGRRGLIHFNIGEKLADLADFMQPDLTVIDAFRVLMDNGPQGGNLEDVALKKTIVIATDPVLADAYACTIVGIDPFSIPYIKTATEKKYGSSDIAAARIQTFDAHP